MSSTIGETLSALTCHLSFFRAEALSERWQHLLLQPRNGWCSFIGSVVTLSIIVLAAVFYSAVVSSLQSPLFFIPLQWFLSPGFALTFHTINFILTCRWGFAYMCKCGEDDVRNGELHWCNKDVNLKIHLLMCFIVTQWLCTKDIQEFKVIVAT